MQHGQRKKVCILGASAVGKTSLVASFSGARFSSAYRSTLGVRITKAVVTVGQRLRELIVWDIKGESDFYRIPDVYMLGCDGYVLVADGTNRATLEHALDLRARMQGFAGEIPHVLLINKLDLREVWEVDEDLLESVRAQVEDVYPCSARGGLSLNNAFESLARRIWGVT
jgi:small GTP-binding protein